jgi:hypothetical protein
MDPNIIKLFLKTTSYVYAKCPRRGWPATLGADLVTGSGGQRYGTSKKQPAPAWHVSEPSMRLRLRRHGVINPFSSLLAVTSTFLFSRRSFSLHNQNHHHQPRSFSPSLFADPLFIFLCLFLSLLKKATMPLKRWEMCQVLGFNSWTAVQVWLGDVAGDAFAELIRDYLAPFAVRGERNPPGTTAIKAFFVRFAEDLDRRVERRVAELEAGELCRPVDDKQGCEFLILLLFVYLILL